MLRPYFSLHSELFAYMQFHTAGSDCGSDARDLAITAPSARQKRQETAVSPAYALFGFPRLADAMHRLTGRAIWYETIGGERHV